MTTAAHANQQKDDQQCANCQSIARELRRRVVAGGGVQYVYQCMDCGRAVSMAISKALIDAPEQLPAWDDSLASNVSARATEAHLQIKAQERAAWLQEHNLYLQSPEWRAKRRAVLKRSEGLCEGCRIAMATQVHHLTYSHWKEEFLWELAAVCDDCHERIHPHMAHPSWLSI